MKRAIKAAQATGQEIRAVEIDAAGTIRVLFANPKPHMSDLDRLRAERARRAPTKSANRP